MPGDGGVLKLGCRERRAHATLSAEVDAGQAGRVERRAADADVRFAVGAARPDRSPEEYRPCQALPTIVAPVTAAGSGVLTTTIRFL
jgi:hypothetical protein